MLTTCTYLPIQSRKGNSSQLKAKNGQPMSIKIPEHRTQSVVKTSPSHPQFPGDQALD